ncbi:MAG: hypothetical protein L6R39_003013, partial [Caloplaca ligustica]
MSSFIAADLGLPAINHGAGMHILLLDLDQIISFSKAFFAATCIFPVAALALKFSILFFYRRIFAVQKFAIWCYIISVVCVAWFIAFVVSTFLICRPLACFWDKTITGCKCTNLKHIAYYVTSPPDILTNIAILILPIPWLWNLQMPTRRKFAIIIIFLLGS